MSAGMAGITAEDGVERKRDDPQPRPKKFQCLESDSGELTEKLRGRDLGSQERVVSWKPRGEQVGWSAVHSPEERVTRSIVSITFDEMEMTVTLRSPLTGAGQLSAGFEQVEEWMRRSQWRQLLGWSQEQFSIEREQTHRPVAGES